MRIIVTGGGRDRFNAPHYPIHNMATKIYNSDLTAELREGAKIQQSVDTTPSELADKVIPTMEVNPKMFRTINIVKSTYGIGGDTTLYTTPTDKDFFLTSFQMNYSKIVTNSNANMSLTFTPFGGTATTSIVLTGTTLTAESRVLSMDFYRPIRLAKGTTIVLAKDAPNGTSAGSIFGYTVDNINA